MHCIDKLWSGSSHFYNDDHPVMKEKSEINAVFGQKNTLVLLVPNGHTASEYMLTESLKKCLNYTALPPTQEQSVR